MDLQLRGKRALVTGASKGIGRAVVSMLAEEGCDLVLVSRDAETLRGVAEGLRARHQVAVEALPADLSQTAELARVAEAAGALDVLVNNAGAIPAGGLQDVDEARWRTAWDLKVFGYIGLTRALWAGLASRRGVVVNVIGAAGETFDPGYVAGVAGNAALMAFTRAMGRAGWREGMRVVGVNPGPVETERMETMQRVRAERELGDAGRWREFHKAMPFGRPATVEEIAAAVAFLASPRSGYTTGTVLTVNGAPG